MRDSLQNLKDEIGAWIRKVTAQSDKAIIRSVFNVYLDGNHLIYLKENSRPADTRAPFFLHVTPVDDRDLSQNRRQYGFESRSFFFWEYGLKIDGDRYVVMRRLPAYPIRRIRTGQFVKDAQGNYEHLWEGEFSMAQAVGIGEGGH